MAAIVAGHTSDSARIFDIIMADFQHNHMPAGELSLDKGIVPTKNSLSIKQFIKDKPNQMGV